MENITALKQERKISRQFFSAISTITPQQIMAWLMCLAFSRASFFGILKPFATAFYVSAGFTGLSKVAAMLSVILGNLFFSGFYETGRQALALLLFEALSYVLFQIGGRKETALNRTSLMAVLVGITGFLRGAVQGFRVYDLVVSVLCAALVFSLGMLTAPAAELFKRSATKPMADVKTMVCKATLLCMMVISLSGIMVWELELGAVFAGLAVLIIARQMGSSAGALSGALLGTIIAFYSLPSSLEITGMLALAGAAAGIRVRFKAVSTTFWTLVVIFFTGLTLLEGNLVIKYYEALAAGVLFLILPQRLSGLLGDGLTGLKRAADKAARQDNDQTREAADRLFVLGKALSRISRNIEETLAEDEEDEASMIEWMIETVAEKVCQRCSQCERCWGTNFLRSYKLVEKSISNLKVDESGNPEIPAWFRSTCNKSDKFFEVLSAAFSLYKTENIWRQRLSESRMMLARQAALVSSSVLSAARSLVDTSLRDGEVENRLRMTAEMSGVPISSFRYHNKGARSYLEIVYETKNKLQGRILDEMVKKSLSTSLVRVGESRRDMLGYSVVRYMKPPRFKTATGIARLSRDSSQISGDNFAFFISSEGYHISAISDGTGSGKRAEWYSRTAIQTLENLIEEGIEVSLAIRLLNLYLNLRGENERLATMDLCAIDLISGETSFYKYGAPPSFIKGREGTQAINLGERSEEGSPLTHYKPAAMTAGDFVVLVSDGVLEAFMEEGDVLGLERFITGVDTVNAQQLADAILQEAASRTKGNHDDMTVLVTRLW
jgi:stage II sporulation protein E